jgi:serine/threonine-protein kinase
VIGAALAAMAIAVAALTWWRPRGETPNEPVYMTALLPSGVTVTQGPGRLLSLALSPDGRTLVIAGSDANGQRLYQRTLGRMQVVALDGTEGASSPFFSPDGAWIGFFADRRLKRVPVGGGASVDIAPAVGYPAGASWGPDNRIVFACGYLSPLRVVAAGGGTPAALTTVDSGAGHRFPEILPDGRTLLFNKGNVVHALDLVSRRESRLERGLAPRYLAEGLVMISRGTTLLAAPFDTGRHQFTGPVAPVAEGVAVGGASGAAPHVAISRNGTLAFVPAAATYVLVLVSPDGSQRFLTEDPVLQNPQFSPQGNRLVVSRSRRPGEEPDLWIYDVTSAAPGSKLTVDGGRAPVWTTDGKSIAYSRPTPDPESGIYVRPADGRGRPTEVVRLRNFHWLVGWSPSRSLVYGTMEDAASDGVSRSSILALENGKARRLVGPGDTWGGRLSPDGRWLAYYSLESGYFEVYVTPFTDPGARHLIAEGTDPVWSPDGTEVYFRSGSRLMAARVETTPAVRVLSRRLVIEPFMPPLFDDYAIHRDGRTLALVRPAGAAASGREITLVLNWLTDVRQRMRKE